MDNHNKIVNRPDHKRIDIIFDLLISGDDHVNHVRRCQRHTLTIYRSPM